MLLIDFFLGRELSLEWRPFCRLFTRWLTGRECVEYCDICSSFGIHERESDKYMYHWRTAYSKEARSLLFLPGFKSRPERCLGQAPTGTIGDGSGDSERLYVPVLTERQSSRSESWLWLWSSSKWLTCGFRLKPTPKVGCVLYSHVTRPLMRDFSDGAVANLPHPFLRPSLITSSTL